MYKIGSFLAVTIECRPQAEKQAIRVANMIGFVVGQWFFKHDD